MTTHNPPDDYLSIATPENVAFGYDIAGIGSRFLAAVVDTLILLALILLVELTLSLIAASFFRDQLLNDSPVLAWMAATFGLIAFALLSGYYIFLAMLWNGQSRRLGDLAAGTLVVRDRAAVTVESLATRPARPAPALPSAADSAPPSLA